MANYTGSSNPLPESDPAYWMLEKGMSDPSWVTPTHDEIYKSTCYICRDPEFALMGLPVCYPCPVVIDGVACGAHVAADDCVCDNDHDVQEYYTKENND